MLVGLVTSPFQWFSSGIELVLEEFPEPVKASVSLAASLLCRAETSDNYIWIWIALAMI